MRVLTGDNNAEPSKRESPRVKSLTLAVSIPIPYPMLFSLLADRRRCPGMRGSSTPPDYGEVARLGNGGTAGNAPIVCKSRRVVLQAGPSQSDIRWLRFE